MKHNSFTFHDVASLFLLPFVSFRKPVCPRVCRPASLSPREFADREDRLIARRSRSPTNVISLQPDCNFAFGRDSQAAPDYRSVNYSVLFFFLFAFLFFSFFLFFAIS